MTFFPYGPRCMPDRRLTDNGTLRRAKRNRKRGMMKGFESDEDLLIRIHSGDEQAFVSLYRKRQGPIFRFAMHMSGSESLAEDITQEVFLALIRGDCGFDPTRGTLSAYLFGIAR